MFIFLKVFIASGQKVFHAFSLGGNSGSRFHSYHMKKTICLALSVLLLIQRFIRHVTHSIQTIDKHSR